MNGKKPFKFLLLVLLVFSLVLSPAFNVPPVEALPSGGGSGGASSVDGTGDAEVLEEVKAVLEAFYIEDLDAGKLKGQSVEEVISNVGDPYTNYFAPEEASRFFDSLNGTFGGVGIRIEQVGEHVTVVAPLKDTPADRAGIKAGDRIMAVNGESLVGASTDEAVVLIRGEPGSVVILRIQRDGIDQPFDVTITRAVINALGVEWEVMEGRVGYVRLHTFGETTTAEVTKALNDLTAKGVQSLVLDVRDNPGGLLDAVVEIAGNFVPPGPIVHTVWRDGKETLETGTIPGRPLLLPMVVLVNGGSASASEILAGAIKDRGTGKIVGTTTFGKGSVQTVFSLPGGGALKLTTAKYQTPAGQFVDGRGIEPEYLVAGQEAQLDYALELLGVDRERMITLVIASPSAQVAGKEVQLEHPPYIEENRTYVPLRFVSESLGAVVDWKQDAKLVTVSLGKTRVQLSPGQPEAVINGKTFALDTPALLKDNAVFVPLRFLAESLGAGVKWDDSARMVTIKQ